MRGLLEKAPGVIQSNVAISKDPKDRMNNSVSFDFETAKTNRAAVSKVITDIWDIAWYECPCSKTSAIAKEC